MRGLVGDLLNAGRIEAGTLSVSPVPTEVETLVEQARSAFLNGGAKPAALIDLPRVMADGPRIVQVLSNLLANAARHSPGCSPIRVAAAQDGPHVAVSDEGKGVPAEQLSRLFRKYASSDEDDAGRRSGGGVGPRARHLQGAGRGAWRAHPVRERRAGRGARFTFTVPVAEDAPRTAGASMHHRDVECSLTSSVMAGWSRQADTSTEPVPRKHPADTAGVFRSETGGGVMLTMKRRAGLGPGLGGTGVMRPDRAFVPAPSSREGVRRAGSAASRRSGRGHRRARPGDRRR